MSLDPAFAERIAARAFSDAMAFFQPSPEWDVKLEAREIEEEDTPAQLWTKQDYLLATVVYDPAQCESGERLWSHIGHEVAHLLSGEYIVLEQQFPDREGARFTHACERLTVRLERLWVRERPYPGDEAFKEG